MRIVLLATIFSIAVHANKATAQDPSEAELINFAFSNYLGTGFYASGGGEVFILRIPLSTTIRPMTSNDPGWKITYPVTLGVANVEQIVEGEIPTLDHVGTVSIIPGVEYHYPVLHNWRLIPFFDLGLARDLVNNVNIRVLGAGAKSFATFDFDRHRLTLGNRFLYADQKNLEEPNNSNFAVFETGLDYNIPTDLTIHGSFIDFGFYYINYFYLKDLVLVDALDNPISLENKNEIGFTFSMPDYSWLPDESRLGFGVQITKNARLYRIVFGMPFF
ncbi:MAG: hypothetical protein JSW45_06295 [Thiotrichales bacterium]|nr:MAG: hypothetical protein JSW45_06295 [Thiotrichales bacterium]